MKKIFFFAAIAALALSSCSSDELVKGDDPVAEGDVVSFSAYQGRANRAVVNDATVELAHGGFGVFAYEQGKSDWATYVTSYNVPNFMFNQQVLGYDGDGNLIAHGADKATTTISEWKYEPVKYFSNVEDAKHSFFAYAPWKSDINVKFSSTGPKIHYSMDDPYDLLWGHKSTDVGTTYTTYKNETKNTVGVSNKLGFTFMHMLAQINVDLTYFSDNVHNDTHGYDDGASATLEEGTKIIVRSVKLVGSIASEGDLDLATGKWVYTNVDESAFEVSNIIFDHTSTPDEYETVFDHLQILPPMNGNTVEIQVVYDVETIDKTDKTGLNNHVVTNTWKSGPITFLQGHAYDYKLHIGMTSVKFNATVNEDWDGGTPTIIDLPNSNYASYSNRR